VSYCPALELSSYGNTPKAAKKAFEEAMEIFLERNIKKRNSEKISFEIGLVLKQKPKPSYKPPTLSQRRSQQLLKKTSASVYDENRDNSFRLMDINLYLQKNLLNG